MIIGNSNFSFSKNNSRIIFKLLTRKFNKKCTVNFWIKMNLKNASKYIKSFIIN